MGLAGMLAFMPNRPKRPPAQLKSNSFIRRKLWINTFRLSEESRALKMVWYWKLKNWNINQRMTNPMVQLAVFQISIPIAIPMRCIIGIAVALPKFKKKKIMKHMRLESIFWEFKSIKILMFYHIYHSFKWAK